MTAPTVSPARETPVEPASSSRTGISRAGQGPHGLQVPGRQGDDVRLAGPASLAEHAAGDQPEPDHFPRRIDGRAAVGAGPERRHQPQLAQAGQLEPEHPPGPQVRLAQMPQGDPRRVEQPGVRVVQVGQLVQQLGDVIAGIQGRQIAAERCEAFHRRGLDHEVHRLGRLRDQHDIGNPHQVKGTLEPRPGPPGPLDQRTDLPQLAGEERHHQAGLEDLDRPQHQGQRSRSMLRHACSPARGMPPGCRFRMVLPHPCRADAARRIPGPRPRRTGPCAAARSPARAPDRHPDRLSQPRPLTQSRPYWTPGCSIPSICRDDAV